MTSMSFVRELCGTRMTGASASTLRRIRALWKKPSDIYTTNTSALLIDNNHCTSIYISIMFNAKCDSHRRPSVTWVNSFQKKNKKAVAQTKADKYATHSSTHIFNGDSMYMAVWSHTEDRETYLCWHQRERDNVPIPTSVHGSHLYSAKENYM